jgi:hypothetical protein
VRNPLEDQLGKSERISAQLRIRSRAGGLGQVNIPTIVNSVRERVMRQCSGSSARKRLVRSP